MPPFHLAIPVDDLAAARAFYEGLLGCRSGRDDPSWVDFDFFGHQLTVHLAPHELRDAARNGVDGDAVPVRHFGVVLPYSEWERLGARLRGGGTSFLLEPRVRFAGEVGEQGTFFVRDPAGNALEFKAFRNPERLFAR